MTKKRDLGSKAREIISRVVIECDGGDGGAGGESRSLGGVADYPLRLILDVSKKSLPRVQSIER